MKHRPAGPLAKCLNRGGRVMLTSLQVGSTPRKRERERERSPICIFHPPPPPPPPVPWTSLFLQDPRARRHQTVNGSIKTENCQITRPRAVCIHGARTSSKPCVRVSPPAKKFISLCAHGGDREGGGDWRGMHTNIQDICLKMSSVKHTHTYADRQKGPLYYDFKHTRITLSQKYN